MPKLVQPVKSFAPAYTDKWSPHTAGDEGICFERLQIFNICVFFKQFRRVSRIRYIISLDAECESEQPLCEYTSDSQWKETEIPPKMKSDSTFFNRLLGMYSEPSWHQPIQKLARALQTMKSLQAAFFPGRLPIKGREWGGKTLDPAAGYCAALQSKQWDNQTGRYHIVLLPPRSSK